MSKFNKIPLNTKTLSPKEMEILALLDEYVVGQEFAKKILISRLTNLNNGLRMTITGSKPPATLLFVGPTGSGKMHVIKSFAKILFGNENAFLRVNCTLFNEGMITQQKVDEFGFDLFCKRKYNALINSANEEIKEMAKEAVELEKIAREKIKNGKSFEKCMAVYYREFEKLEKRKKEIDEKLDKDIKKIKWEPGGNYQSIVVFEGVDEMHPGMINVLREILDSGTFTSSNGVVSFRNCFIFMECNLLSEDIINDYMQRSTVGFMASEKKKTTDEEPKIFYKKVTDRVVKMIPLKLLKEIGKENIVVFRPFSKKETIKIIEKRLECLSKISLVTGEEELPPINVTFTPELKEYIYKETRDSVNLIFGASPVDRIISLRISGRLNKIVLGKEFNIKPGDIIEVGVSGGEITFEKVVL